MADLYGGFWWRICMADLGGRAFWGELRGGATGVGHGGELRGRRRATGVSYELPTKDRRPYKSAVAHTNWLALIQNPSPTKNGWRSYKICRSPKITCRPPKSSANSLAPTENQLSPIQIPSAHTRIPRPHRSYRIVHQRVVHYGHLPTESPTTTSLLTSPTISCYYIPWSSTTSPAKLPV